MFRRYVLPLIACVAFVLSTSLLVSAQSAPMRGRVTLKQADGTIAPAVGAVVDIFRTDLSSGDFEVKTDKKGEFVHAGLPLTGIYTVSVSMPGAQAFFIPNVRAGREDLKIELATGDGKRLTRADIKTAMARTPGASSGESAEEKAKREELIKKNKEIEESNKHAEATNATVARTFKAGNDALTKKDYSAAITQYDEGLAADPEQPALLTNRAIALKNRAVDTYNTAIKSGDAAAKTAGLEAAKKDWQAAYESSGKGVAMLRAAAASSDTAAATHAKANMYSGLATRAEATRFFVVKVDPSKVDEGAVAFQEYIAAEVDPVKKAKAEHERAQMFFDAFAYEKAKPAYEEMLAQNPDDPEALKNLGLTLFNLGADKESQGKKDEAKVSYQEAANYLQRFVDKTSDGQLKTEAQEILKNLKEQQNVQAEKSTPTRTPIRKPTRKP